MAYYLGIGGLQAGPKYQEEEAATPYVGLNQSDYNMAQPLPVQQVQQNPAMAPSSNPLVTGGGSGKAPVGNSVNYAKNVGDIPEQVLAASQKFLPGSSGYGDPSQGLFNRNLLRNYNQWEGQYEKMGEDFVPWALQSNGANIDPSSVNLFSPEGAAQRGFDFTPSIGRLTSYNQFFNPITGQSGSRGDYNPNYASLSRNFGDINQDYISNQFGNWRGLGAQNLPTAPDYTSGYYRSLMPNFYQDDPSAPVMNQPWWQWFQGGMDKGILPQGSGDQYQQIGLRHASQRDFDGNPIFTSGF